MINESENNLLERAIEDIEQLEVKLVQHIRVCGLIQNKEYSLVEEVLNIRKKRRQIVKVLQTSRTQLEVDCADLLSKLEVLRKESNDKIESKNQEKQGTDLENEYRKELKKIRNKYRENLHKLEAKINTLEAERNANNLSKDSIRDLHDQNQQSMQRYNENLVTLSTRINELSSWNDGLSQKLRASELKFDLLSQKVNELKSQNTELQDKCMLEIRGEREDLSERFQKLMLLIKSERYKYKIDSDNIVRAGNEALDREKKTHEIEMGELNEKVRKTLIAKDDIIQKLRSQITNLESRAIQAEEMIKNIRSGFG